MAQTVEQREPKKLSNLPVELSSNKILNPKLHPGALRGSLPTASGWVKCSEIIYFGNVKVSKTRGKHARTSLSAAKGQSTRIGERNCKEPSRSRASKKCAEHFQLRVWSPTLISFDKNNFLFKSLLKKICFC